MTCSEMLFERLTLLKVWNLHVMRDVCVSRQWEEKRIPRAELGPAESLGSGGWAGGQPGWWALMPGRRESLFTGHTAFLLEGVPEQEVRG